MSEAAVPVVLIAADPGRVDEIAAMFDDPLAQGPVEVLRSTGGDDTMDLAEARRPQVAVVCATLQDGDATSLVEALRGLMPRGEIAIVLVGDADGQGPMRTALDAMELGPERFVSSPVIAKALRFAVGGTLEAVSIARGGEELTAAERAAQHAKWSGSGTWPGAAAVEASPASSAPSPSTTTPGVVAAAPRPPAEPASAEPAPDDDGPSEAQRAQQRARWEALADSMVEIVDIDDDLGEGIGNSSAEIALHPLDLTDDADPLPPPLAITPRRGSDSKTPTNVPAPIEAWQPGNTSELREQEKAAPWSAPEPPQREPTLIIADHPEPVAAPTSPLPQSSNGALPLPPLPSLAGIPVPPDPSVSRDGKTTDPWAGAMPLASLSKQPARELDDDIDLDAFDEDLIVDESDAPRASRSNVPPPRIEVLDDPGPLPAIAAGAAAQDGRDFARQLRAKMSMMAQRLFQGGDASAPAQTVDLGPRHDHHTEIDLSSLGDEPALERGSTEIEARDSRRDVREPTTSPGSWDTQIRERGLPDTGDLVRGVSDAAMLLAKMFAQASTARIAFRDGGAEKVVFFDQGRPVFASSSEQRDRMGELLVREGKITAAQYERCQAVVAESGRRMGEILVDFGYLKRRELLPAVRRHVEDIVYSLFAWDRGTYHVVIDASASAERIRLSRHPAALILEGIRRKLDRTSLERLVGGAGTVIEVPDRERLGGIINLGDLAVEERSALTAFDGLADLAAVARTAGVDVTDVLPLAWGLCVLGLATARRTDTEVPDESAALVGETDLAIDRERVRARWQLVSEADYFALLGVRRDATAFEIRRAYQSARRDFATDSFPLDLRRELAQELDDIAHVLDEAFRVLRDDRLRVTYLSNLIE